MGKIDVQYQASRPIPPEKGPVVAEVPLLVVEAAAAGYPVFERRTMKLRSTNSSRQRRNNRLQPRLLLLRLLQYQQLLSNTHLS